MVMVLYWPAACHQVIQEVRVNAIHTSRSGQLINPDTHAAGVIQFEVFA